MSVKKTSDQWQTENPGIIILNPLGWDADRFESSFYEDEITYNQFMRKVKASQHFIHAPATETA